MVKNIGSFSVENYSCMYVIHACLILAYLFYQILKLPPTGMSITVGMNYSIDNVRILHKLPIGKLHRETHTQKTHTLYQYVLTFFLQID